MKTIGEVPAGFCRTTGCGSLAPNSRLMTSRVSISRSSATPPPAHGRGSGPAASRLRARLRYKPRLSGSALRRDRRLEIHLAMIDIHDRDRLAGHPAAVLESDLAGNGWVFGGLVERLGDGLRIGRACTLDCIGDEPHRIIAESCEGVLLGI